MSQEKMREGRERENRESEDPPQLRSLGGSDPCLPGRRGCYIISWVIDIGGPGRASACRDPRAELAFKPPPPFSDRYLLYKGPAEPGAHLSRCLGNLRGAHGVTVPCYPHLPGRDFCA